MSNELSQFEARAYKRLYEMYKSTLLTIVNKAKIAVDYKLENQEEMNQTMQYIADEHKWEHCGIESKTDGKIIDELEKCLGV
jgi:hypothetical protein